MRTAMDRRAIASAHDTVFEFDYHRPGRGHARPVQRRPSATSGMPAATSPGPPRSRPRAGCSPTSWWTSTGAPVGAPLREGPGELEPPHHRVAAVGAGYYREPGAMRSACQPAEVVYRLAGTDAKFFPGAPRSPDREARPGQRCWAAPSSTGWAGPHCPMHRRQRRRVLFDAPSSPTRRWRYVKTINAAADYGEETFRPAPSSG